MSTRKWISTALVVLAFCLALGVTPALAAKPYELLGSFKVPTPRGIAVEAETGDVLVFDESAKKVLKLDSEGVKVGEINGGETPQKEFSVGNSSVDNKKVGVAVDNACYFHEPRLAGSECEAFDPSNGNVYVVEPGEAAGEVVYKFKPKAAKSDEYEYVGQLTGRGGGCPKESPSPAEHFFAPAGVAVDTNGNVYVAPLLGGSGAFGEPKIFGFDSKCQDLPSSPLNVSGPFSFPSHLPFGVAADGAGNIYSQGVAGESFGSLKGDKLIERNIKGEFSEIDSAGSEAVAVNPANGEVFVVDSSGGSYRVSRYNVTESGVEKIEEFGTEKFSEEPVNAPAGSAWVAYSPNAGGEIYITNYATGEVHIYTEEKPGKPKVMCEAPEVPLAVVQATTAKLAGKVNPGSEPAKWQFEYATKKEYEKVGAFSFKKAPEPAGSSASEESVEIEIKGLTPQTEYFYRLSASNKEGVGRCPAAGPLSFTTKAAVAGVTKCTVSSVTSETATLEASFEPNGRLTKYHFQYSTSLSYTSSETLETPEQSSSSTTVQIAIAAVVELEANRTYYCRLVGNCVIEAIPLTTYGESAEFTTSAVTPSVADGWAPSVGPTWAVLNAFISPENSPTPTTYYIEYVEAAHYHPMAAEDPYGEGTKIPAEGETPLNAGGPPGGQNIAYHLIERTLEGLAPGTTYHFRVVARNAAGATYGKDETFTTVPILETSASGITQTGATLSGTVDPEGLETSWVFEYGTTNEYGTQISGQLPPSTQPQTITATLSALSPATTYHYRLTTKNSKGPSYATDQTFTTQPATTPEPPKYTPITLPSPPSPPQLTTPPFSFPTENGELIPEETRAQKLAKALKACKKKPKHKRAACEKQARKKYGTVKKTTRHTHPHR